MSYIRDLVAETRTGNPVAAEELADFVEHALERPERRVCTAFGLNRRSDRASVRTAQRQKRDELLVELTDIQPGKTPRARIKAASSKLERYATNAWPHERNKPDDTGNRERDLMRKIMRTGLPILRERRHRTILGSFRRK